MQQRDDIVTQGSHLYSKALVQLKEAIENPSTAYRSQNVAATMALSQYEALVYTDEYGWVQHAGGTGRLMQMRGPERYQDEPDHTCFLLSRFSVINQACVSRKPTFLAHPDWQTIPWAKNSSSKTHFDELLNILADVPACFEEFDRLSDLAGATTRESQDTGRQFAGWLESGRALGPDQAAWERLREQLISSLQRLEAWRKQWEASKRTIPVLKPIDPTTSLTWDPALKYPASSVYQYPDLPRAYEVCLYFITHALFGALGANFRNPLQIALAVAGPRSTMYPSELARLEVESPSLPRIWMNGPDLADWAVRSLDFLLEERHRGKCILAALSLLRIW